MNKDEKKVVFESLECILNLLILLIVKRELLNDYETRGAAEKYINSTISEIKEILNEKEIKSKRPKR